MAKGALKNITVEERQLAIEWINTKDMFTAAGMFEHFKLDTLRQFQKVAAYRNIINAAKRQGYLQSVSIGKYMVFAKLPLDMVINANGKWQEQKILTYIIYSTIG